jgi:ferrous iron transport protein A
MRRGISGSFPLAKLRQGARARIVQVDASSAALKRLGELGLIEGTEFTLVKVAPLGDPVEIDLRGYRLCLRKSETSGIEVEELEA